MRELPDLHRLIMSEADIQGQSSWEQCPRNALTGHWQVTSTTFLKTD